MQISVEVANTQVRCLRVGVEKGFTRTTKGSELAGPKANARAILKIPILSRGEWDLSRRVKRLIFLCLC